MSFIERIANLAHKSKTENHSLSSVPLQFKILKEKVIYLTFNNEKRKLAKVYSYNSATTDSITNDSLALSNPEKFIAQYTEDSVFIKALNTNPEIKRILEENNLPVRFYKENITSIITSHLIPTAKTAQKIYKNLGHGDFEINFKHLTEAALLHDIGKAFIPDKILNKHGFLTPRERHIIELHNRLSYEILRTTNLSPIVAQYALEHHNYDGKVKKTQENQSLTVADIYCALREKRPYKKPLNDLAAKTILYDMGTKGKFDTSYISKLNN